MDRFLPRPHFLLSSQSDKRIRDLEAKASALDNRITSVNSTLTSKINTAQSTANTANSNANSALSKFGSYYTAAQVNSKLGSYYTKSETDQKISSNSIKLNYNIDTYGVCDYLAWEPYYSEQHAQQSCAISSGRYCLVHGGNYCGPDGD